MKKIKQPSDKLYEKYLKLKDEVISTLKRTIGKKTINLEDTEQEFTDEANNTIVKVDKNNVYFDGEMESYPLGELGMSDALHIMGIVEGKHK